MLDGIERVGRVGHQALGNQATDKGAFPATDKFARGTVDFDQTIVAHHDHGRRNRVNRGLPTEPRQIAGHGLLLRARDMARHRLLAADPPRGQQPQRKPHHKRRHFALYAQRTDREHADPGQHIKSPDARPAAVTERRQQDGAGRRVSARACHKRRGVGYQREHQCPQDNIRYRSGQIDFPATRLRQHLDGRGRVFGGDQKPNRRVDSVERQPGQRERIGTGAHRGKRRHQTDQQQRGQQAPLGGKRDAQIELAMCRRRVRSATRVGGYSARIHRDRAARDWRPGWSDILAVSRRSRQLPTVGA